MKTRLISAMLTTAFAVTGCASEAGTETEQAATAQAEIVAYRDSTGVELGSPEALLSLRSLEAAADQTPGFAVPAEAKLRSGTVGPRYAALPEARQECSVSCSAGITAKCSILCSSNYSAICHCSNSNGAMCSCVAP